MLPLNYKLNSLASLQNIEEDIMVSVLESNIASLNYAEELVKLDSVNMKDYVKHCVKVTKINQHPLV